MSLVGKSVVRVDAASKAKGAVKYTDDLEFDGLYGKVVRSTVAHGNIVSITFDKSFDFSGFTIVDYRDIEGRNANVVLTDDQPFLAEKKVKFIGEPILLLAHRSRKMLKEAVENIHIEYELLEPVFTMQESLDCKNTLYGGDNIFKTIQTVKGIEPDCRDLESLQKRYSTPHQEQLYMETQGMVARYSDSGIKVVGSMQCPFYVESALFELTGEKIEVEQAPTGGAFGGKEDYPSLMAAYAYLLSKKAKRDVKLVYEREEDIAYTTKRHPSQMQYKSCFDKSGKLHALYIDIVMDGGAYSTLTPVVLARAVLHAAGFYDCGYIAVNARAVATNTPPNGAFRGFGAPQAIFGIERHMDDIARHLGISPAEVRERNLPGKNSLSVSGAKIGEYKRLRALFDAARKASGFDEKYAADTPYKGIGMALFMHGGGFTGSGETMLASKVWLDLLDDGTAEIRIGSVEMGQGTLTALSQIVADALELPVSLVGYHLPNTAEVADSGPTVASRTVMIVGELLTQAARQLKEAIGRYGDPAEYLEAAKAYLESGAERRFRAAYRKPDNIKWDEERFYGNGYDSYSLGCYVAEVEVDPVDYRVRVSDFYAYNDIGKAVNPVMAEGQVEGGVAQAIGYALYEKIVFQDGRIRSSRLSDYSVPMAADLPKLKIAFLNTDDAAKGLGELPMNGPAAAVANALTHALDSEFDDIAITPEIVEQRC